MKGVFTLLAVLAVGYVALQVVFGIAGGVLGLLFSLAWFLLKLAIVGSVVYFGLKIVAPDAARRLRDLVAGGPAV